MKKTFLKICILVTFAFVATGCVGDDDFEVPSVKYPFFAERFEAIQHNSILDLPGWINYAQEGNVRWMEREFDGDGYAQFNPFGSTNASSIAWLISPMIDLTDRDDVKCSFSTAQNFVSSSANKLEAFVSTDFDGMNVEAATWTKLDANIADQDTEGYLFVSSGEIDLAEYEAAGHVYIGFRAVGSGTVTSLDGLFQVNDLFVYSYKN